MGCCGDVLPLTRDWGYQHLEQPIEDYLRQTFKL
jgi:hypothetical protein